MWDGVFKAILGAGGVAVLLFAGLWWLNKNNNGLIVELKAERENRIKLLELESASCKADRIELHKQVNNLQDKIIDIYKSRDQKVIAGMKQTSSVPIMPIQQQTS